VLVNSRTRPPIIIMGMHRSGTGMIALMLEELGLYMGKKKDPNHEARFFLNLNEWLLRQSGGSWDRPEPVRDLVSNAEVRGLAVDYICHLMKTPHVASYLGWRNYFRYGSPKNLDIPWGWKDPRNAYTLPLWLDLFPDAKVIHIYRHGVDVAKSLQVRQQKLLMHAKLLHQKRKAYHLYKFRQKRGGFTDTLRCTSLAGGFSLWEAYVNQAKKHLRLLGPRAVEVKYEDFVDKPVQALTSLVRFCGINVRGTAISSVAARSKKGRAYAYLGANELRAFAEKMGSRIRALGY
jgi:hypothetical protein